MLTSLASIVAAIFFIICINFYQDAQLEEIRDTKLNDDFEKFEAQQRVSKYKFGVLYCADGQVEENDIYSNGMQSPRGREERGREGGNERVLSSVSESERAIEKGSS